MDNSENDKTPELDQGDKRPKMWGVLYLVAGITGICISIYSGFYDLKNIVPLFGSVVAGILVAALSILMMIYGYRLLRRDI